MILIKRYANRKLYNTDTSRYITLKGIAELLEAGEEVSVIDNETGDDITSVALSQILVNSERNQETVPKNLLSGLVHRGGDVLYSALRKGMDDASTGVEDLQRGVRDILKTREEEAHGISERLAAATPDFEQMIHDSVERVFKILDLPRRSDIEALNRNLQRVADAVESLDRGRPRESGQSRGTPSSRDGDRH